MMGFGMKSFFIFCLLASIQNSHGCTMEGVSVWQLPITVRIEDYHEGIIFQRAISDIGGFTLTSFNDLNAGPYVVPAIENSAFVLRTNEAYKEYEENETFDLISLTFSFSCTNGAAIPSPLTIRIEINDNNNNPPLFKKPDTTASETTTYEFTIAPPVPPGFLITKSVSDIIVRDIDLTTRRIDFEIEDNPYVEIAYDAAASTNPKEFKAVLRTTSFSKSVPEPIVLKISATDVDQAGDHITRSTTVTIQGSAEFELPVEPAFSQAFYLASYTENYQVTMEQPVSLQQGYDELVQFSLEGDYAADHFSITVNGNQVILSVTNPLPAEALQEAQIYLVVNASREHTSGAATTIVVQLPEVVALEFQRSHYEGEVVDNTLQLAQLILSQGFQGPDVYVNVEGNYTSTDVTMPVKVNYAPSNITVTEEDNFAPTVVTATAVGNYAPTDVTVTVVGNYAPIGVTVNLEYNYEPTYVTVIVKGNYVATDISVSVDRNFAPTNITVTVEGNRASTDVIVTVRGNYARSNDVTVTVEGNYASSDVTVPVEFNYAPTDVTVTIEGNYASSDVTVPVEFGYAPTDVTVTTKGNYVSTDITVPVKGSYSSSDVDVTVVDNYAPTDVIVNAEYNYEPTDVTVIVKGNYVSSDITMTVDRNFAPTDLAVTVEGNHASTDVIVSVKGNYARINNVNMTVKGNYASSDIAVPVEYNYALTDVTVTVEGNPASSNVAVPIEFNYAPTGVIVNVKGNYLPTDIAVPVKYSYYPTDITVAIEGNDGSTLVRWGNINMVLDVGKGAIRRIQLLVPIWQNIWHVTRVTPLADVTHV